MPAIRADDLFYLYRAPHGDVAALRGLSLEVAAGETVAVLGPSGSGKTTLLTLCAGLSRPSSGTLRVLERSFERMSQHELSRVRRAEVGIVRQHYRLALPRELTAEEIVGLPLRLVGRRDRDRVRTLLGSAGLDDRRGARPEQLSGGEQQRVAVCAALAKRPRLVLADEPTGELDEASTEAIVALLLDLATADGAAVMIVTHDTEVAQRCARTIHIRDGRLAAEGTARPMLIVDEHGWLRLPRSLREEAGVGERVRARASWGRVELLAESPGVARRVRSEPRLEADEKRATEIALDRVTKRYDREDAPVVDSLSWLFAADRLHVVAGPSGSGKTTILNLQAALDYPSAGEIWVGGERVDSLNEEEAARFRRRMLGYVSQHSTLVDFLSARENVELALALRGLDPDEARRRAEHWLGWVGLADLLDRRADRLSGGEQRRVALARALAPRPRVLLADEPTAHLDQLTGRHVIQLLRAAAHDGGTTVVAASHDPDLIAAADERLVLGGNPRTT
jgi:ABC-type lipoprotein export system ATPase subunit